MGFRIEGTETKVVISSREADAIFNTIFNYYDGKKPDSPFMIADGVFLHRPPVSGNVELSVSTDIENNLHLRMASSSKAVNAKCWTESTGYEAPALTGAGFKVDFGNVSIRARVI